MIIAIKLLIFDERETLSPLRDKSRNNIFKRPNKVEGIIKLKVLSLGLNALKVMISPNQEGIGPKNLLQV